MTALNTGVRRAPLKERKDDLYETPPCATEALLRVENIPARVWEPCCGPGAIARVLRAAGRLVIATDLVNYQSPDQDHARIDFLMERFAPGGVECIVTNPPFKLAGEFAEHALRLVPRVYMLLRTGFIESDRRSRILDGGQLRRIYQFANRLPMMHRNGFVGPKTSSAIAHAWYCWDREYRGDIILRRIRWERAP